MKRVLVFSLAGLLAIGLAGCTDNAGGEIEGQFAGNGPGFRFRGGRFM